MRSILALVVIFSGACSSNQSQESSQVKEVERKDKLPQSNREEVKKDQSKNIDAVSTIARMKQTLSGVEEEQNKAIQGLKRLNDQIELVKAQIEADTLHLSEYDRYTDEYLQDLLKSCEKIIPLMPEGQEKEQKITQFNQLTILSRKLKRMRAVLRENKEAYNLATAEYRKALSVLTDMALIISDLKAKIHAVEHSKSPKK